MFFSVLLWADHRLNYKPFFTKLGTCLVSLVRQNTHVRDLLYRCCLTHLAEVWLLLLAVFTLAACISVPLCQMSRVAKRKMDTSEDSLNHKTCESIFMRRKKVNSLRDTRSHRLRKGAAIPAATRIKHYFIFTYAQYHQRLVFYK